LSFSPAFFSISAELSMPTNRTPGSTVDSSAASVVAVAHPRSKRFVPGTAKSVASSAVIRWISV
jgi:hypothetical protein